MEIANQGSPPSARSRLSRRRVLSGCYAAECALKACIAKKTERFEFPDKKRANEGWTHDLTSLARQAGVLEKLNEDSKIQPKLNTNWTIVSKWTEESRYRRPARLHAEGLLNALEHPVGRGDAPWRAQNRRCLDRRRLRLPHQVNPCTSSPLPASILLYDPCAG